MKNILSSFLILLLIVMMSLRMNAQQGKPVLNHIAHYVQNLKTSTAFYMDVVKLDTIPEPFHDGKHTWFAVSADSHLHLIEGAKNVTAHDKNSHLCFSAPSVDEVIARLKARNIPYENWAGQQGQVTNRVDGIKQIYFRDPDGYWIEFNDDYPKTN